MRVEILTVEGCPHAETTRELVQQAVRLEAADAVIDCIEVNTSELAQRVRFLGSPSVRIDGEDVERPANMRNTYGLMCRTYFGANGPAGTPPIELIRAAIRRRAGRGT